MVKETRDEEILRIVKILKEKISESDIFYHFEKIRNFGYGSFDDEDKFENLIRKISMIEKPEYVFAAEKILEKEYENNYERRIKEKEEFTEFVKERLEIEKLKEKAKERNISLIEYLLYLNLKKK